MAVAPPLAGAGVRLRPLAPEDGERVRAWRNRDDVRRWFVDSAPVAAVAQQAWVAAQRARAGDFAWIVEDAARPGTAVGLVSLHGLGEGGRVGELGRVMAAPEARGGGHQAPALRAVIRHAFDDLGLDAIGLDVKPDNAPALRLYRRCGFRQVAARADMLRLVLDRQAPEAQRPALPPHPARTVWLASYPKSGNTWLRIVLANLLHPDRAPVDINRLPMRTPLSAARPDFDRLLGVPSALLTAAEIARLRPQADRLMAAASPAPVLLRKAHDAWTLLPDGRPLLGAAPDVAALYLVRDPADVALSAADHFGHHPAAEAAAMLRPEAMLAAPGRRLSGQLTQRLLDWAGHVRSWATAPLALHVMRYEEARAAPLRTFRAAIRFLGFAHDDAAIMAALDAARLDRLQAQETATGFAEGRLGRPFFRHGRIGQGARALPPDLAERLAAAHAAVQPALQARGF
ncbi:GNAT family N-acetyltransferase [Zavarzinia sp. CC-PAN008]|uniref:GNAT family N-acetyltransferase n=1 Tax=Zavarzinia sp. CC-PAN008 TaxID=3243332 RepID=UPI003F744F57